MGQKEKEIKAMAIGLLTQKFMNDAIVEMQELEQRLEKKEGEGDPRAIQWMKDNFIAIVTNRVNTTLDFMDKRRLTTEEYDNLMEATQVARIGYERFQKARELKHKEKEERKAQGEQVAPV